MKITALCMTHGRPYLLEESLESWRRQIPVDGVEYEFLIVNDCPEQTLSCDLYGVRVVNMHTPYTDMSQKQNESVERHCEEWVAWWDDDDIWMPFRFAESCRWLKLCPHVMAFKHSRAWYAEDNRIVSRPFNLFVGSGMFHRDYYLSCGGAEIGRPADSTAWKAMAAGGLAVEVEPSPEETHYIYRWGGPGVHDSSQRGMLTYRASNAERHREFRKATLSSPLFRPGAHELCPRWKLDYEKLVADAIRERKGDIT